MLAVSGFKEQRVHLCGAFGSAGLILQGIIGVSIDVIKAANETIPE